MSVKIKMIIMTSLLLLGLGLSSWLTYLHVRVYSDPTYESVCALSERVNCETVAMSEYSIFLGLPVSVWGILAYLGMIAFAVLGYFKNSIEIIGVLTLGSG